MVVRGGHSNVPEISQLLDEKEAAAKLGLKPRTLAVWRCVQRYPLRFVKIGRRVMYRGEDVQRFIELRTHSGDGSDLTLRQRRIRRRRSA